MFPPIASTSFPDPAGLVGGFNLPYNPYFPGTVQAPQALPFGARTPLFQGTVPAVYPPFQVPGLDQLLGPSLANLAPSLVLPYLQPRADQRGLFFGGSQPFVNLFDQAQGYEFQQLQTRVQQYGAGLDQSSLNRTFRGLAQITGTPFGLEQARAADRFSGLISGVTPLLAPIAPDLVEQFYGPQGSAAVLAQNLALQSRYRPDLATGRYGLSPDTVEGLVKQITDGFRAQPDRFSGVTLGEAGVLYGELNRRGLLTTPEDLAARNTPGLDRLADDDRARVVRLVDANRVKDRLGDYSQAIRAVREIFGDSGRQDAPLPELIQALDQLTQGTFGQVDPTRLQGIVRNIRNLSQISGLGIEGFNRLSEFAGGRARQQGLSGEVALQSAIGAGDFAAAVLNSGQLTTPGTANVEALSQIDIANRQSGLESRTGNQLGALRRLFVDDEEAYKRLQAQAASGSPEQRRALAIVDAARNFQPEFTDPTTGKTVNIGEVNDTDFIKTIGSVLGQNGQSFAAQYLNQEEANRAALTRNPDVLDQTIRLIREAPQTQEFGDFVELTAQSSLSVPGLSADQQKDISQAVRDQVLRSISGDRAAGISATNDPEKIQADIAKLLETQFGLGDQANVQAGAIVGELEDRLNQQRGFGLATAATVFSPEVARLAKEFRQQRERRSKIQEALAPLSPATGTLGRFISALQNANESTDLTKLALETVGGTSGQEIADRLKDIGVTADELKDIAPSLLSGARLPRKEQLTPERAQNVEDLGDFLGRILPGVQGLGDSEAREQALGQTLKVGEEEFTAKEALGDFLPGVEDLVIRSLQEETLRGRFSNDEILKLQGGLRSSQSLRSLADLYAGGDVTKLLSGDIDPGLPKEIVTRANRLFDQTRDVAKLGREAFGRTGAGYSDADILQKSAATEGAADIAELSNEALVSRLSSTIFPATLDADSEASLKSKVKGKESQAFAILQGVEDLRDLAAASGLNPAKFRAELGVADETGRIDKLGKLDKSQATQALGLFQQLGGESGIGNEIFSTPGGLGSSQKLLEALDKSLSSVLPQVKSATDKTNLAVEIAVAKVEVDAKFDIDGKKVAASSASGSVKFSGGDAAETPTIATEVS